MNFYSYDFCYILSLFVSSFCTLRTLVLEDLVLEDVCETFSVGLLQHNNIKKFMSINLNYHQVLSRGSKIKVYTVIMLQEQ